MDRAFDDEPFIYTVSFTPAILWLALVEMGCVVVGCTEPDAVTEHPFMISASAEAATKLNAINLCVFFMAVKKTIF